MTTHPSHPIVLWSGAQHLTCLFLSLFLAFIMLTFSPTVGLSQPPAPTTLAAKQLGQMFHFDRLEFKNIKIVDALRLIAEQSGVNAVATQSAGAKTTTVYLQHVTAREAIETIAKISALWFREDKATKTFFVMTTEEYQKDIIVFREDFTEVFTLRHPNTVSVATAIQNLYGQQRVSMSFAQSDSDLFSSAGQSGGLGFSGGLGLSGGGGGFGGGGGRGGLGGGFGSSGRIPTPQDSRKLVDEEFTSAQISELERRIPGLKPGQTTEISAKGLRGLTRKEAQIFVTVVRQHNLMIVRTSDEDVLNDIKVLVEILDRPTRQVLLVMKILELTLGDNFRSIFDIGLLDGSPSAGPADGQPANPLSTSSPDATSNILGIGNFSSQPGTFVYQFLSNQVRARIELMQQNSRVEVLATPMIMSSNLQPARIFVGEQRVLVTGVRTNVITAANASTTTVVNPLTEIRDIGTTLILSPTINLDGTVTLQITQDNSTVLTNSTTIPVANAQGGISEFPIDTVNTATILGTIVAKDRLTLAMGGLIRKSVSHDVQKVPLLGDLPWIGALFRREVDTKKKTELILLITPYIIRTPEEGGDVTMPTLQELSDHQYFDEGDQAMDPLFENDPDLEPLRD